MNGAEIEDLAYALGRVLTDELTPEEAVFYDELIEASNKKNRKNKDADLAFGINVESVALPVFFASAAKLILNYIWTITQPTLESLAKEAAEEARKALLERFKRWIVSKLTTTPPVKLQQSQVDELIQAVERSAADAKAPDEVRNAILAHIRSLKKS